jgi:2-polyprenyl-3-methyl-5-hydroxy-6-metoxy-1,4-benzoquinol methylase
LVDTGVAPAIAEGDYEARRCPACDVIFVTPRPLPSEILAIYEHDASQTRARAHVAKTREPFALAHARHLLGMVRSRSAAGASASPEAPRTLLEIGAGGGLLLTEARAQGYDVAAIEPNGVLAAFLADRGIPCESSPLGPSSFGGLDFDVIVHVNVLSHFYDPVEAMRTMASRLRPGGVMVFETGNFADVTPRYYPLIQASERFQLPEHLTFFGERSLARLLEAAGLSILSLHRYSRVGEKRGPALLRRIGLGRRSDRLRFWLKYRLGRWLPKAGRPLSLVVVCHRRGLPATLPTAYLSSAPNDNDVNDSQFAV